MLHAWTISYCLQEDILANISSVSTATESSLLNGLSIEDIFGSSDEEDGCDDIGLSEDDVFGSFDGEDPLDDVDVVSAHDVGIDEEDPCELAIDESSPLQHDCEDAPEWSPMGTENEERDTESSNDVNEDCNLLVSI